MRDRARSVVASKEYLDAMLNRSRWHRLVIGAMESAFALTAGITCARSQFPTPADGDWTEGRGRLAVRGGWRFLHLEGSPREMGLQHGRLLRPVIQRVFEEYIGMIRLFRALSRAELLRRGRRLEPHIPAPYLEEMRGLADGAAHGVRRYPHRAHVPRKRPGRAVLLLRRARGRHARLP